MYAIIAIIFFVAAMFSGLQGNINQLIGLAIVSGLFSIASGISAIFDFITERIEKIVKVDVEKL